MFTLRRAAVACVQENVADEVRVVSSLTKIARCLAELFLPSACGYLAKEGGTKRTQPYEENLEDATKESVLSVFIFLALLTFSTCLAF